MARFVGQRQAAPNACWSKAESVYFQCARAIQRSGLTQFARHASRPVLHARALLASITHGSSLTAKRTTVNCQHASRPGV